jgi:hypothetical protein
VDGSNQQSALWVPTGAAGCEGLVPARVPARLSWAAPAPYRFEGDPLVDGEGDLSFAFDAPVVDYTQAFFPADGSAGFSSPAPTENRRSA